MRRGFGVLVIEVKDWNLSAYQNPKGGLSPWFLMENGAKISSPLEQVQSYKNNFYNLHLDLLFERKIKNTSVFSIVQPVVYFHKATQESVNNFCHAIKYMHILGVDSINENGINYLLSSTRLLKKSPLFDDELYNSFRRFLNPPEHSPDVGKEIYYTQRQKELVSSAKGLHQKIKGVAGCGKTKVLARRAVNAYARSKETVLILTFNITLRNYIHDKISEVRLPFPWSVFEITNYHQFFKNQANNYNLSYDKDKFLQEASDEMFFESIKTDIRRYETILIDEIQDYEQPWLKILINYFLSSNGEFVVFGDEKQNIYGREMGDDKLPKVPTIVGRWNELKQSFRLDKKNLKIAKSFQDWYFVNKYIIDSESIPTQENLLEESGIFLYQPAFKMSFDEVYEIVRNMILKFKIHPNDIVILAPNINPIRELDYRFRIFSREKTAISAETKEEYDNLNLLYPSKGKKYEQELKEIRRGRKLHFWGNSGVMKFSTIHSFKGWESHTLILLISNIEGIEQGGCLDELIYVALTRVCKNLLVIDMTSGHYQVFFQQIES